jgi:hypothetical protein
VLYFLSRWSLYSARNYTYVLISPRFSPGMGVAIDPEEKNVAERVTVSVFVSSSVSIEL